MTVKRLRSPNIRNSPGQGEANAFQHQLLAAILASEWSEESAWAFLTAHEREDDNHNPYNQYLMDTINNSIGMGTALQMERSGVYETSGRTTYIAVPRSDLVDAVRANIESGNYVAIERQG